VNDDAVFDMQRRLGVEEGLWVEPVSAAPLTALTTLLDQGDIKPDDRIICIMSGAGFKDTHLVQKEAEAVAQRETVPFDVQAIVSHVNH